MSILNLNIIKKFLLKCKYKNILFQGDVKILGKLPHVKMCPDSSLTIGSNVVINSDFKNTNTALTYRCKFVMGYVGIIELGTNTMLNGVSITAYKRVVIGDNCQIASCTLITDTDFHPVEPEERLKQVSGQRYDINSVNKKEVVIGNNVWIGWGAIILKGTQIGDNSIVAAGSVVRGVFPNNVVISGNPAKVIKQI